ncbi:hypothetical protein [Actinacidiphila rubida]|uniref:Sigma-70 family RNA polymerase sigma factor n=1 Tax=Actinacidiphila rubida TaxID=310780 RepID=A0A1H8TFP8_9ACTN|nr:hypothetical protein [Actinacidiphila rubida]SEO89655.1 hypothetical protein SAMN05216267_105231 [Actinacidiphila rubida]
MNRSTVNENAFDRLNAEWRVQCANSVNGAVVAGWLIKAGVFEAGEAPGDLAALLGCLAFRDRRHGRAHSDVWLTALLGRAVGQNEQAELACRVVIQAMLPAAMAISRRMRRRGRSFGDAAHAVTAALCEVVAAYPLQRRPRRIAANLAMDTLQRASLELARDSKRDQDVSLETVERWPLWGRVADPVEVAEFTQIAAGAAAAGLVAAGEELTGARAEMADLLVWALCEQVLEPDAARVLAAHYREGPAPDTALAAQAGVSTAAVRQCRARAKRRLRDAAPRYIAAA